MKRLVKQLFCKHSFKFVRNIYGDEIYMTGRFKRSWWKCEKCGLQQSESFLVDEGIPTSKLGNSFIKFSKHK